MQRSVVREWVAEHCTLKMQTVMLSALRGPDGIPKEDISKRFTRKFRSVILYPAVPDTKVGSFMNAGVLTEEMLEEFTSHLDHYPNHWVTHFAHACEIVGYKHPDAPTRLAWQHIYYKIVWGMHMRPETELMLDERLADAEGYVPE